MRSAQPLKSSEDIPDAKTYKLVGTQMSLVLALALEETDSMSVDISEDEVTEVETVTHKEASDSLNPTLIEDSKDGGGGYFLIGPEAEATETFSLSLCLGRAQHLQLAAEASTVHPDPFYWRYNLLGVDVTSEMFPSLETDFTAAEEATGEVRTSCDTLSRFLAASSVTFKLCTGAEVVAAADLSLSCLQEAATAAAGGREVNVRRSLALVSSHNFAVAEDSAGNRPWLEVQLSLVREDAKYKFSCRACGEEFRLRSCVTRHILTAHIQDKFEEMPDMVEGKFHCPHKCSYTTAKKDCILAHLILQHTAVEISEVHDLIEKVPEQKTDAGARPINEPDEHTIEYIAGWITKKVH